MDTILVAVDSIMDSTKDQATVEMEFAEVVLMEEVDHLVKVGPSLRVAVELHLGDSLAVLLGVMEEEATQSQEGALTLMWFSRTTRARTRTVKSSLANFLILFCTCSCPE